MMDTSKNGPIFKFLESVELGIYEAEHVKLPQLMPLVEVQKITQNNALHICAKKHYFATYKKILDSQHPGILIPLTQNNNVHKTPLECLLDPSLELIEANYQSWIVAIKLTVETIIRFSPSTERRKKNHDVLLDYIKQTTGKIKEDDINQLISICQPPSEAAYTPRFKASDSPSPKKARSLSADTRYHPFPITISKNF